MNKIENADVRQNCFVWKRCGFQPLTLSSVVTFEETMPPFSMLRLGYIDGASEGGIGDKLLLLWLEARTQY